MVGWRLSCIFIYGDLAAKYLQILESVQLMPKQSKASRHSRAATAPTIPPGTYLCERILDVKIERGQRHYLIKWKGYDDPSDNTWEPLCNLENLIEDLISFEEEHASRIRKYEEKWRQKYKEGDVSEPLQEFDIEMLRERLDRLEQLSNTPESTPPPPKKLKERKEKREEKAKQIVKKKNQQPLCTRERRSAASTSVIKEQYKRQEREEEKSQAKIEIKVEKEPAKRRGRKPKKPALPIVKDETPKVNEGGLKSPQQDHSEMVDNKDFVSQSAHQEPQADLEQNSNAHHFLTPERNIEVPEDGKKTSSQERGAKCEQEHFDDSIYHESPERPFLQQSMDQGFFDRQQLNNQINSYFENFSQDNSVSEVLSKRITPPLSTVNASFSVSLAQQVKRESIFKNLGMKYPQSSRAAPLNPTNKKYMIYRKRKAPVAVERSESDSQSQSHSQRSILKSFPNNPILELEEEQKESSPVSSNHNRNQQAQQVDDKKEEAIKEMQCEQNQRIIMSQQPKAAIENGEEVLPMRIMKKEEQIEQEEQRQANDINQLSQNVSLPHEVEQEEHVEPQIQQQNQDISVQPDQHIVNNQEHNSGEMSKKLQIENINAILDHFQQQNDSFIEIESDPNTPPQNNNGKRKEQPIEIDEDSPKKNRNDSHPEEGHKFCALPINKTKRIKKQFRQERSRRGIVGRSQESLVQDGQKLHYRPSLNTVLQGLLSEGELKLLSGHPAVRLCSSFRMENVIIFSAQVQSATSEPETRFISYQTLRESYPRELLTFLEEQGMIEL